MKSLLPLLTLTTLSLSINTASLLAAIQPSWYLPHASGCAVYQGGIDSEKVFTFWIENKRQFTIKADNSLQVAVALEGKIVAPYQVASLPNHQTSEFTYRTSTTGNHTIFVRGIATQAHVTICLN